MLGDSESLVAEMNRLQNFVNGVLDRSVRNADDLMLLRGVSQGRQNVETLARLALVSVAEQQRQAQETPYNVEVSTEPQDVAEVLRILIDAGAAVPPVEDTRHNGAVEGVVVAEEGVAT